MNSKMIFPEASEVLEFWFGDVKKLNIKNVNSLMMLWFGGSKDIDNEINKRFRKLMDKAILGELDSWMELPKEALALIILLDQFSLNIFRNQARAFTINHLALPYALKSIKKGYDKLFSFEMQSFFYLPLEHAEDIHLQNMCVELYENALNEAKLENKEECKRNLEYAINHKRVIKLFNRFPNRNEILGRPSTQDEMKFLNEEGSGF